MIHQTDLGDLLAATDQATPYERGTPAYWRYLADALAAAGPLVDRAWAETARARMDEWVLADHVPPGLYRVHAAVEIDPSGVPHAAGVEHGMRLRDGLLGPLGPVLLEPARA